MALGDLPSLDLGPEQNGDAQPQCHMLLTLAATSTELTVSTTLLGAKPYQLNHTNMPPTVDRSRLLLL